MKAYLTAFSDQLSGYIDIKEKKTEIYLPFLPRMKHPTEGDPYTPDVGVIAAKFTVVGFVQYEGKPGLVHRIPHYKFVGLT